MLEFFISIIKNLDGEPMKPMNETGSSFDKHVKKTFCFLKTLFITDTFSGKKIKNVFLRHQKISQIAGSNKSLTDYVVFSFLSESICVFHIHIQTAALLRYQMERVVLAKDLFCLNYYALQSELPSNIHSLERIR